MALRQDSGCGTGLGSRPDPARIPGGFTGDSPGESLGGGEAGGAHLQANDHVPQEIVLPFVFASIFKDPEKHKQPRGWDGACSRAPAV